VEVTGPADGRKLNVEETPLSLEQQVSLLDTLILKHEGKEGEQELLEDVRITILQNRIAQELELAEPEVVNEAYLAGKLGGTVRAHVWAAADEAREKSGLTIEFDPAGVRRLIWAIMQVVPANDEVLKDLDMDALLLSAQKEADPVEATAPTPAFDGVPL
jgi:hypothetical protein